MEYKLADFNPSLRLEICLTKHLMRKGLGDFRTNGIPMRFLETWYEAGFLDSARNLGTKSYEELDAIVTLYRALMQG